MVDPNGLEQNTYLINHRRMRYLFTLLIVYI